MKRLSAIAILLVLASSAARADECLDKATTQVELNGCAGKALEAADAALNEAYQAILKRLGDDAEKRKLLVGAEKAWLSFRDAECAFSSSSSVGGSIHPMIFAECLTTVTEKRLADLTAYLHCEEGDLSCPVPAGQ